MEKGTILKRVIAVLASLLFLGFGIWAAVQPSVGTIQDYATAILAMYILTVFIAFVTRKRASNIAFGYLLGFVIGLLGVGFNFIVRVILSI